MKACHHVERLFPVTVRVGVLFAAGLAALGTTGCEPVSDRAIELVSMSDVAKAIRDKPKSYLVLDARDAASFRTGHLPGAKRLTAADVDVNDPDPKFKSYKSIFTYGQHPNHNGAKALTKRLMSAKVSGVYLMDEGFLGWKSYGYAVEVEPEDQGGGGE